MTLNQGQKEALQQGFLQVGLSVILYVVFAIIGFVSAILLGYILVAPIVVYVQGIIVLLTQTLGSYLSLKTLQSGSSPEQH